MFRLRLQVNGAGGRPVEDNSLPFDGSDGLPSVEELRASLAQQDARAAAAGQAPRVNNTDLANARDALVQTGAARAASDPAPDTTTTATNQSLQNACNHINSARSALMVAQSEHGMDFNAVRESVTADLAAARQSLSEATHPAGRRGVNDNYQIRTELHPQGVSVREIRSQLTRMQREMARLPTHPTSAVAGVATAPQRAETSTPSANGGATASRNQPPPQTIDEAMARAINSGRNAVQGSATTTARLPVAPEAPHAPEVTHTPPDPNLHVSDHNVRSFRDMVRYFGGSMRSLSHFPANNPGGESRNIYLAQAQNQMNLARGHLDRFCAQNRINPNNPGDHRVELEPGNEVSVSDLYRLLDAKADELTRM